MADWKKLGLMVVAAGALEIWMAGHNAMAEQAATPAATAPAPAAQGALEEDADIENLVSIQGEVTAVDPKNNSVSIKDSSAKDPAKAVKTLTVDPKTTTIWGEYDEIKVADLPVGSKVAGEYKTNPNGSMTATYLEIVLDEDAELPPLDEATAPGATKAKPAEKPVE